MEIGIHNGERTQSHDQFIIPPNFRPINKIASRLQKDIPVELEFVSLITFSSKPFIKIISKFYILSRGDI